MHEQLLPVPPTGFLLFKFLFRFFFCLENNVSLMLREFDIDL